MNFLNFQLLLGNDVLTNFVDNLDVYFIMIVALAFLAIGDLVVGVSNDAVNFLNSALGSKAISVRKIMILASLGVLVGSVFSSGMMEVARKGIFNPEMLLFSEIMIIFMAVMITDILLLDFFNTLGLPTSTTVSIVFELLGAAVAVSLIKISGLGSEFGDLVNYINVEKASQIILGILLSVFIAFSVGALVQFISRTLLSYSENEATIAKELLTIAQKERAADQTDAAAVLAAEEALEGALKDLSDDSMSLLTTVYEILDVINLLEPDMVEDTTRVGTFNTSS